MGPSVRVRRRLSRGRVCIIAGLGLIGAVGGCGLLNYVEPDPPAISIRNSRDETVVVRILGTLRGEDVVEAGRAKSIWTDKCLGDGLVIEDVDGNVIAERDGEVCPGRIWLRSDGSVSVMDEDVAPPTP